MGMNLNNDVFSTGYVLSKCDTNKDGKTTVTEFLKERNNSIFGYDDLNKKAIALLKDYAGSDGILSTAEYASWLGSSDYDKLLEENKIRREKIFKNSAIMVHIRVESQKNIYKIY